MASAVSFAIFVTVKTIVIPGALYNNYVTRILGKCSFEIYACQGFFLPIRKEGRIYIDNPNVFIGVAIIGKTILSFTLKPIYENLTGIVKNYRKS